MKIRSGFVSNSSSTSFLVIAKDELTEEGLLELMGVDKGSPLSGIFRELFDDLLSRATQRVDFREVSTEAPIESWFDGVRLSERMREKLQHAKEHGLVAYVGMLSSDSSLVQQFFCTDSFEAENDKVYLNALECVW